MTTLTMKDETRLAIIQRVYRSELTVAVAEQVIAEIDRDRDGAISQNEASSYAELQKRDDNQSAGESDFTFHPQGQLLGFERCGSC